MTTALAGLGIGGIAIAFAAQKTLENLFGGISLLGDEVIQVGDVCRFGDRTGTSKTSASAPLAFALRNGRELSIPNGSLATMNIENLSRRDKILFNTKLGLRYETSADQLRYVLAQIRRLLYEHPKVETDGARIRFIGFDNNALTLEIFCYILTRDAAESLAIQEDLLLRIIDIIEPRAPVSPFPLALFIWDVIPASITTKPPPSRAKLNNGGRTASCLSPTTQLLTSPSSAIPCPIRSQTRR